MEINLELASFTKRNSLIIPAILLLAAGSQLHADDGYPEFGWDRVPLYAHLGIGEGLEPEQYHFLADRFKLIAFTGGILRNASVEPNMAAAAKAIKQRNPKAKVLFYWASDMPKHQWKESNATFPEGGYLHARKGGFPLACFLVGAERHCYFCYTWGWLGEYGTFDWYPEFDKSLGEPKGAAKREGWKFRREFEHASVFVDVEKKSAKIDWK